MPEGVCLLGLLVAHDRDGLRPDHLLAASQDDIARRRGRADAVFEGRRVARSRRQGSYLIRRALPGRAETCLPDLARAVGIDLAVQGRDRIPGLGVPDSQRPAAEAAVLSAHRTTRRVDLVQSGEKISKVGRELAQIWHRDTTSDVMAALSTDRIISRSSPPGHAFSPGDAPVRAHARRPGCVSPRIRRHIWRRDRRAAPEGVPGFGGSDVSDSYERTRTPQATVFTELSPSSTRSRSQPRSSRVTMQVLNRPGESRPARPPLSSRPIHLPARLDLRRYLPQGGGAVHHASLTVRDTCSDAQGAGHLR